MSKPNLHIIEHPVVQHKLSILRDKKTQPARFRRIMSELSEMLAYESTRDLELKSMDIETPLEKTEGKFVEHPLILVPILRAGNGMLDGMLNILPFASVGHVGIYRDKFIDNCVEYFFRIPNDCTGHRVLLLDPLLATAETAIAAIDRLKDYGVGPIRFVSIVASPGGIKRLHEEHPDVDIVVAKVDRELNDKGYILPGIGDAGDRLYGTMHNELPQL